MKTLTQKQKPEPSPAYTTTAAVPQDDWQRRLFEASGSPMGRPTGEIRPLPLVGHMDGNELANWMGEYTHWKGYMNEVYNRAQGEYLQKREEYEQVYRECFMLSGQKNEKMREYAAKNDPRVQALHERMFQAEMFMKGIGYRLNTIESSLSTLSREITRRSNQVV